MGLIGIIGFGLIDLSALSASAASLVCWLIGLVSLVSLSTHSPYCNHLTAAILTAAAKMISRKRKQSAHGVAMVGSSATKITNAAIYYYCIASLYYAHLFERKTMWWWLALARKQMCWWIVSFGESFHKFCILSFGIQADTLNSYQCDMLQFCILCFGIQADTVNSYHSDLLHYAKQLSSTRFPQMIKYCVMRECENIHWGYLYVCDLHEEGNFYF
jgi:hypothetical protein